MMSSFTFIHIEPSSDNDLSFPAEIYWGTIPDSTGRGYVVNPRMIERWANWDQGFYQEHLISSSDLETYGSDPKTICEAISRELSGKTVYTKNREMTGKLLDELFLAAGFPRPVMQLLDLEDLFQRTFAESGAVNGDLSLAEIRKQVIEDHPAFLGGGAFERLYYAEIWKRIQTRS